MSKKNTLKSARVEFRMYEEMKRKAIKHSEKVGCSFSELINKLIEKELFKKSA